MADGRTDKDIRISQFHAKKGAKIAHIFHRSPIITELVETIYS